MEIGSVRSASVHGLSLAPQSAVAAPTNAGTELPASQTVQPVAAGERARADSGRRTAEMPREVKRETTRDETTESIVFRATDEATGEVIRQIPEEAMLRLRQALAEGQSAATPSFSRTL